MLDTPVATSPRSILMATAVALAIGAVVLVVAVLPAEYRIDPLGTGKALASRRLLALGKMRPRPRVRARRYIPVLTRCTRVSLRRIPSRWNCGRSKG
jgi:hypothetical protein